MLLGDVLLEKQLIDKSTLEFALEVQKTSQMRLGEILVNNDIVPEHTLYTILASQWNFPFVPEIRESDIDEDAVMQNEIELLDLLNLIRKFLTLPLTEGRLVTSDIASAKKLFIVFGYRHIMIAPPSALLGAIETIFLKLYADKIDLVKSGAAASSVHDFVNLIIRKAIQERASDIHFEPGTPSCIVRYRVDGDLKVAMSYKSELHPFIVNVILMASAGNPPDERTFEEASFAFEVSAHTKVSIRVSKAPSVAGQGLVLRILKQDLLVKKLDDLGFEPEQRELMSEKMITQAHGIILVSGPTGSGKSTTLHAFIGEMKGKDKKILSIEDPVEIRVPFVEQVSVNPAADITFDTAIKYFLRRDPDVILVGEIRDRETAKVAFEAALTGHLVLASVHANTVFDTFLRLNGLGVSYSEMSAIVGITNQTLVKRKCDDAIVPTCKKCRQCTGYFGRMAQGEVLYIDDQIRKALRDNDIKELSRA